MSPAPSTVRFARARPVADAPVDALLARADELAGRWASALIAARPLAEMATVPLEGLAREAPALCAQLARALRSDGELEQLLAPPAEARRGRAGESRSGPLGVWLAPARDASSVVRDLDALRGIILEAALGELRDPTVRQAADLSDRVASVCAELLAAALDRRELSGAPAAAGAPEAVRRERVLYSSPQTSSGGHRALLIDERDESAGALIRERETPVAAPAAAAPSYTTASPGETAPEPGVGTRAAPAAARPRPWDTPLDAARDASGPRDHASQGAVPDGTGAEMRVTRGPGARVDERA